MFCRVLECFQKDTPENCARLLDVAHSGSEYNFARNDSCRLVAQQTEMSLKRLNGSESHGCFSENGVCVTTSAISLIPHSIAQL
eukprot:6274447-Amphidinium_carterae.1